MNDTVTFQDASLQEAAQVYDHAAVWTAMNGLYKKSALPGAIL